MIQLLLAVIYISFISLGLPDSLLGSAWPTIYQNFGVSISYAGILSMIIACGTIVSSLQSDQFTRKLGTGKVTAISVFLTAVALYGFSISNSFWMLCVWAIPYGIGAGSVDASLNNYVALNYTSRHMSWLHCMWGVGASLGPAIMGFALSNNQGWHSGFRYVSIIQFVLSALLIFSLPLWKSQKKITESKKTIAPSNPLKLNEIIRIIGAKEIMITFFCYCALESTAGLWASSYLVLANGLSAEKAASFASMFFIGITAGRFFSGFLTIKMSDSSMIRLGQGLIAAGVLFLLIPSNSLMSLGGLICIGFGCAPIYPCIIHSTPMYFGVENSQAVIGVQMASAYVGACIMPPLFGALVSIIGVPFFPVFLGFILCLMIMMHERLLKKTRSTV